MHQELWCGTVCVPMILEPRCLAGRLESIESVLHLGAASRLLECARILRGSAEAIENHGVLDEPQVQLFTLALQDASLMAESFEELMSPTELRGAKDRLRRACQGPAVEVPGAGNDAARNELWELYLCGRFRSRHLEPRFGDDVCSGSGKKPDLMIRVDTVRLAVEAKRIRFLGVLEDRITKAVAQVGAACRGGLAEAGILALDVSFAFEQHPQHGLWMIAEPTLEDDVRRQLKTGITALQHTIRDIVLREPDGHFVVGTTVMVMPTLRFAKEHRLGLARYFATSPYGTLHDQTLLAVARACFAYSP